jgi:hypothetical protein
MLSQLFCTVTDQTIEQHMFDVRRWLHAHGVHASAVQLPVVLGLPDGVVTRLYGQPLVRIDVRRAPKRNLNC